MSNRNQIIGEVLSFEDMPGDCEPRMKSIRLGEEIATACQGTTNIPFPSLKACEEILARRQPSITYSRTDSSKGCRNWMKSPKKDCCCLDSSS